MNRSKYAHDSRVSLEEPREKYGAASKASMPIWAIPACIGGVALFAIIAVIGVALTSRPMPVQEPQFWQPQAQQQVFQPRVQQPQAQQPQVHHFQPQIAGLTNLQAIVFVDTWRALEKLERQRLTFDQFQRTIAEAMCIEIVLLEPCSNETMQLQRAYHEVLLDFIGYGNIWKFAMENPGVGVPACPVTDRHRIQMIPNFRGTGQVAADPETTMQTIWRNATAKMAALRRMR